MREQRRPPRPPRSTRRCEMRTRTLPLVLLGLALVLAAGAITAQSGQTCGGIAGLPCPEGQACKYEAGQCNTADLAGTCVNVPNTCPTQGAAVCGCDGKTYANECQLLKAGVRPAHKGSC